MSTRRPIRPRDVRDPSRIASNLTNDYIEGNLDDYGVLFRVLVVEIDPKGGVLEAEEEPKNPPNSFRGRVLTRSRDKFTEKEDLPIFWPMFSHDIMPIKEGEHVYALFEDSEEKSHGLWIARIPDPNTVENVNYVDGNKKFEEDSDNDMGDDRTPDGKQGAVSDTEEETDKIEVSSDFKTEEIPTFTARVGDRVIQGSNNTTIVLGRDRPAGKDSGEKDTAGTVDIVAGRTGVDDMDMKNDLSRIYISMNSDVDANFEIQTGGEPTDPSPGAAIVVKSDEVRIVARNGMKIVVEGGQAIIAAEEVIVESGDVKIGSDGSAEGLVLGTTYRQEEDKFLDVLITQLLAVITGLSADGLGAGTFLTVAGVMLPGTAPAAATALIEIAKAQAAFKLAGAPIGNYVSKVSKTEA